MLGLCSLPLRSSTPQASSCSTSRSCYSTHLLLKRRASRPAHTGPHCWRANARAPRWQVRGLEPLFAVILVRICRARGRSISGRAALGLLSLLVGAAFTCLAQKHLSWLGLLLGLGSNLMFALRSLLTTQLQDKLEMSTGARLDASALFCYQHIIGLGLVAPLALANGGWHCARALGRNHTSLFYGVLSSVCFYAYNRLSLAVLLMLNALAHSVANSLRRAVTIGFAAVAFRTQISALAASGIVLIIGGSLLYALSAVSPRPVQPIVDMESAEESPDLPAADATKATDVHVDDRGDRRAAPETRALLAERADSASEAMTSAPS